MVCLAVSILGAFTPPTTPPDHARVQLVGISRAVIVLDDDYLTDARSQAAALQLPAPPGRYRLRLHFDGGRTLETAFRAGRGNLLVLRGPDFAAPLLPHPNEPLNVGSLHVAGRNWTWLTIPELGIENMDLGGAQSTLTRVPAGRYEAEAGFTGTGKRHKFVLEIAPGQQTALSINTDSGAVESDNAAERAAGGAPMPVAGGGYDRRVPGLELELVWIPPGSFAKQEAKSLRTVSPARTVTIARGYWIGRTEITQTQWRQLMEDDPSYVFGPDRPVNQVSWRMAQAFCERLTAREAAAGRLPPGHVYTLPTEAQWEYACRAGDAREVLPEREVVRQGWVFQTGGQVVQAVGRKPENAWGVADMIGNVAELCLDWDAQPAASAENAAQNPASATAAVRGGSVEFEPMRGFRYSDHEVISLDNRSSSLGFRVVLTPQPAASR